MAEITTHRVERKPPRSNTPRLVTHEDVQSKPGEIEVVKASDFVPTPKPPKGAPARFAAKSEE